MNSAKSWIKSRETEKLASGKAGTVQFVFLVHYLSVTASCILTKLQDANELGKAQKGLKIPDVAPSKLESKRNVARATPFLQPRKDATTKDGKIWLAIARPAIQGPIVEKVVMTKGENPPPVLPKLATLLL